jgi:tRNA(Ile)-lysidine synthase
MPISTLKFGWSDVEPRVFAAAIMWVSGADYRPRFQSLCDAAAAVVAGQTRTLHGVKVIPQGSHARLIREFAACSDVVHSQGGEIVLVWDKKWQIFYERKAGLLSAIDRAWPANLTVRAVGEAISDAKNWRKSGLSHASATATPGIFDNETLISAPGVGFSAGFTTELIADFHS